MYVLFVAFYRFHLLMKKCRKVKYDTAKGYEQGHKFYVTFFLEVQK
jgi:hypothetical protein